MRVKADESSIADEAAAFLAAISRLDCEQKLNLAFVLEEAVNLALQLGPAAPDADEARASSIA